jgi:hypothetical protein
MVRNVLKIIISSLNSGYLGSSFNCGTSATLRMAHKRIARSYIFGVSELLDAALNVIGVVGILRLPP